MVRPIVVLGSINADRFVEVPRLPHPGETLPGRAAAVRPGGKGANQAAAAARLGWPTRFLGFLGEDDHAEPLRAALEAAGVDAGGLRYVPGPSGQALILLQADGENSIVLIGGANRAWPEEVDDGHRAAIEGAAALLLQREVPDAVDLAAARIAAAAGVPVILDAGGSDRPIDDELLAAVDCLSPNRGELAALSGVPADDPDAIARGVAALRARGAREVLVKLGADGCSHHPWPEGAPCHQPAFAVPAVDTTGAGDCFTAAWAVAMLRGEDPPRRCRFACAAAACCIRGRGAMPSMPDEAAVAELLAGSRADPQASTGDANAP